MKGDKVRRSFKKIDNIMYICNASKKEDEYFFELLEWEHKKEKLKINYIYNTNLMFNTGFKSVSEYLLNMIEIKHKDNGDKELYFNQENFKNI